MCFGLICKTTAFARFALGVAPCQRMLVLLGQVEVLEPAVVREGAGAAVAYSCLVVDAIGHR